MSKIGVIMLNTGFPRLVGDIGNPDTFDRAVDYEVIEAGTVGAVVGPEPPNEKILHQSARAAQNLERRGATVIGSSCGFLYSIQDEICKYVSVPVLASALLVIPTLRTMYGTDAGIGILTYDRRALENASAFQAMGSSIYIQGIPKHGHLYRVIKNDLPNLDYDTAQDEVTATVQELLQQSPDIRLFVFECTNLSPYKAKIIEQFGHPVFDLVDMLKWVAGSSEITE